MIHTSQQSVRKQKAKTIPSTDELDLKTSCTGQQHGSALSILSIALSDSSERSE
jgi:hypothetical protein